MSGLIELNLGQQKLPAVGYAAHVPHYLANSDYPKAAIALIDQIALNTGLVIPRDDLRQSAIEIDEQINQQVSAVAENREVVESLEQQHDDVMQSRRELTATPEGNLISGDELAAALEQYLADLDEKKSED